MKHPNTPTAPAFVSVRPAVPAHFTWLAVLGLAAAIPVAAQTAPVADSITKLEKFEVNAVPIEQSILPSSRPFNSVFGTDLSVLDTPRNVTIISREQLTAISIEDVRDFSKLTTSSFTRSNFGAPANPDIRGQYADVFINGQRGRITSNGNGLPIDFNAVESANIVKGPATAVQGVSAYVGGLVDFITKRPTFDGFKGSTAYTVGSYDTNRWTLDLGGPVSKQFAYRFSYSGEHSGSYYYDGYKHTQAIYGAVTWKPTEHYELFLNASYYDANYTENFGINRPTQQLIDNGLYVTGININNGANNPPSDPQNSKYVTGGFPANVMRYGPTVTINRHLRLLRPGDHSSGRQSNVQAIQTLNPGGNLKIENSTIFSYTKRQTLSSYFYSEVIDPSWFVQNRTLAIFNWHGHAINAGLAENYQRVKAYNDYFSEPAAVWDITRDRTFINMANSVNFPGFGEGFGASKVPGHPGRFATAQIFNNDTNDSFAYSAAPFVQATWHLSERVAFFTGGRVDYMHVRTKDPFTPGARSTINFSNPNFNGSLTYKFNPSASAYVTYNYSRNYLAALGNGGGFANIQQAANGRYLLPKSDYRQPSELVEAGSKFTFLGNKLFLSTAVFQQTRQNKPQQSAVATYRYRGFEIEGNYQPNKQFYATLGYSLIEASVPATQTGFEALNVTPVAAPTQQVANSQTRGRVRLQGMPRNTINGLASYTFASGFGASANVVVTSRINNNWAGTIVIPWQYELDASVFYKYKQWDFRLNLLNATDEKNWSPPNGVYGNESIIAEAGIRGEFTVKMRF